MVTKEYRTLMYSIDERGEVVVHRFPWNGNDRDGREKLEKFIKRGFTFQDPRAGVGVGIPEVVVTREVDLGKPELVREEETETDSEDSLSGVTKAEIIEEGGLLYPCSECGFKAKSPFGLIVHMRKHERERGERKPYKRGGNK